MVDYLRGTGSTGTMMLRDTGSTVEFWLKSGQSATNFGSVIFDYSSPNGSGSFSHGYSAGNTWQLMGAINVSGNGNVSWTMRATGTQGFGGPTTQTVFISRAFAPAAPTNLAIDILTHQSFRSRFSGNSDGGSPIREWQIGYGTDPNGPQYYTGSWGATVIGTNFMPGSTVYTWVRGRNDVGWGPWSNRLSGVLIPGVRVRVSNVWKHAIPYVKINDKWVPTIPYVKEDGSWQRTRL